MTVVIQTARCEREARLLAEFETGREVYLSIILMVDDRPDERRYVFSTTCGKSVFYREEENYGKSR